MNNKTRYTVLDSSIIIEKSLAELIKLILRIKKGDTKTLDNKSSSLSFKAKVDLLLDLNDLNKADYQHFIRFAEIRNQFMHNHKVETFLDLPDGTGDLKKYLNKKFPCKTKQKEELRLGCSFDNLQATVRSKIDLLQFEYEEGKQDDIRRFIAMEQIKRIDTLIFESYEEFKFAKKNNDFELLFYVDNLEEKSEVEIFIELLKLNLNSEEVNIICDIPEDKKDSLIHSRKVSYFDD